jgi:hypothetical protein
VTGSLDRARGKDQRIKALLLESFVVRAKTSCCWMAEHLHFRRDSFWLSPCPNSNHFNLPIFVEPPEELLLL